MIVGGHVILSHGLESGPNATKVSRLAAIAESAGWSSERPDYSTLRSAEARIALLTERCALAGGRPLVLVGSSMGAYISAMVSLKLSLRGLFLLAPPVAMPNATTFDLCCEHSMIVHGWDDELIPAALVTAFAQVRALPLLMVQDDHRLSRSVDLIAATFQLFLQHCEGS